ncbi:hypothetical protein AX15_000663 [Amanita polypyramis BW_CC]|nr:hypothetical protein AX15_000663 [Amanita polypyramis BW_CC]
MLAIGSAARTSHCMLQSAAIRASAYSTRHQARARTSHCSTLRASPTLFIQAKTMSSTVTTDPSISVISTTAAAAPLAHYSQAIRAGNLLFVSGCVPVDPVTGKVVEGGIEVQTEQTMKNLKAVVEAGGSSLGKVVKSTVFLKSVTDFAGMNGVYAKFFGDHKPARSAIEIGTLPLGIAVEIECIAVL